MNVLEFVILALATWRIGSLLAKEDGPFGIFQHIRLLVGVRYIEGPVPGVIANNFFAKLITCVWCNTIWIGAFFALMFYLYPVIIIWIALPFALSAAAIMIEEEVSE